MIFVVSGLAAASSIEAAQITVAGHVAQPAEAAVEEADGSMMSHAEWLDVQKSSSSELLLPGQFRYGAGFGIRSGISRRGVFRYRIEDYLKIRFPRLRTMSQHGRLGGRQNYRPDIQYTRSFRKPTGFRSSVQYGFR